MKVSSRRNGRDFLWENPRLTLRRVPFGANFKVTPSRPVSSDSDRSEFSQLLGESRGADWPPPPVHSDRFFALWLLVVTTGFRRGELAGLQRHDI